MPPQVGVGVAAYIFDYERDMILMLQRTGSHGGDTWSVPGGWVEPGESLLQAAVREVKEEVGLTVTAQQEFGYTEDHFPEGVHDICFTVVCEWDGQGDAAVTEPEKVLSVEWVSVYELHKLNLFLPMRQRIDDGSLISTYKIFKEQPI